MTNKELDIWVENLKPGQLVEVNNHPKASRFVVSDLSYDYAGDPLRCPACKTQYTGQPWMGWFWCGRCNATSLVKSGRVLIPLKEGDE